jgi:hypothetical protein
MRKNKETAKADNTILIQSEERHRESSGGRVEHDTTTEYHLDLKTRQVIQKVWDSYDNAWNPRENYHHRLESEKILTLEELPKEVRQKVKSILNNIH